MSEARWVPSDEVVAAANLTAAMRDRGCATYGEFYEWSAQERAEFWGFTIDRLGIVMADRPETILAGTPQHPVWLRGARLNIAESCFHADPGAPAVVHRREGRLEIVTSGELHEAAGRLANALVAAGVVPGDRVAIAMPMNLESVIAYLGIVLSGAVVVSIADSFAPAEIATRLRIAPVELVVTQDVIIRAGRTLPMYDKVVTAGAARVVVLDTGGGVTLRPGDVFWRAFLADASEFAPVARLPEDAMNILFSSGTTGDPKAIPWTHAAPIKAASDGHYHQDIQLTDRVAWPTNLGWMMGPWLIYATLINGAAIALHDDVPTAEPFAQFVVEAGVTILGVVPSLVASWRASGVVEGHDWSRIRLFSSTGEAANSDDMAYLMDLAGNKPIMDYIGGTELAGAYLTGTVLQPCVPATFTTPTLGGAIHILDEAGNPARVGEVFIEPPTMGLSLELLNRDNDEVYYSDTPVVDGVRLRRHGDRIEKLPNGRFRAQGRVDDVMNLGAIKVSSAEIERAVAGTAGLVEAAAIAVDPPGGGPSALVMYVVIDQGVSLQEVAIEMQQRIRTTLNPLFRIADVVAVDRLPRTASAKVMRRSLRTDYSER
ncbi:MAG: AMP-binding protein [Acidimicrobiia bacterium]|nr:AMP-binding protein [Acidimicrobiia bacterium]